MNLILAIGLPFILLMCRKALKGNFEAIFTPILPKEEPTGNSPLNKLELNKIDSIPSTERSRVQFEPTVCR